VSYSLAYIETMLEEGGGSAKIIVPLLAEEIQKSIPGV
jgi:hypothetical protein